MAKLSPGISALPDYLSFVFTISSEAIPLTFSFLEDLTTIAGALGESRLFLRGDLSRILELKDGSSIKTTRFFLSSTLFLSDSRSSLAFLIKD